MLVFIGHYFPAQRAGGPAQSLNALVDSLRDTEFYIFTSDTDFGSRAKLDGVVLDRWQRRGAAWVFYASDRMRSLRALRRTVAAVGPDVIYLNSFFARRFTLPLMLLRWLRLLPGADLVVAPRGELAPGAMALKPRRKCAYVWFATSLGLYRGVRWHAASVEEARDIAQRLRLRQDPVVAGNFALSPPAGALENHVHKLDGRARIVFLSRISAEKNLHGAIEALRRVRGLVSCDIFGPLEDLDYWSRCQDKMVGLPENVSVSYMGAVSPGESVDIFLRYDALFLPTFGESYGHVIVEAWAAATPVIISDRTPWTGLESGRTGWIAPPNDHAAFANLLDSLVAMHEREHVRWRRATYSRALALAGNGDLRDAYARLLAPAVADGGRGCG